MDSIKTIKLAEALPYLDRPQETNVTLFINNKGDLETFFNYKGQLIELNKLKMKIDLGKSTVQEVGEEIRSTIIMGLQKGYCIVLNLGGSENFDLHGFLSKFSWYKNDFFENCNFRNTQYLKKNNLVTKDEDVDHFGNSGGYKVDGSAKIFVLSLMESKDLEKFLSVNQKINFDCVNVE